MLSRRAFTLALSSLLACQRQDSTAMLTPRPRASLPRTTLPWLDLTDHFVATVGARAGQGHARGPLLVLADATFAPHSRFPLHPHREMEILSVVLSGTLSHHGDQAHGAALPARSAQLISARSGMFHAEGNDTDEPCRMLQIWLQPRTEGGEAIWYRRDFPQRGRVLIAGDEGMPLRADARVWWVDLEPGLTSTLELGAGRLGYLLALDGPVHAGASALEAGDGLDVAPGSVALSAAQPSSVLWIDAR